MNLYITENQETNKMKIRTSKGEKMTKINKLARLIFKGVIYLILLIGVVLFVVIGIDLIFTLIYRNIHQSHEIHYISNDFQPYLVYFIMVFVVGLLTNYMEDRKLKKKLRKEELINADLISDEDNKPNLYKIILIIGISISLIASYLSFKSYNIFYEDHFAGVRLLKEDKTYTFDDVQSFTISNAKRFELKNFSMKLHMKDGESLEFFGGEYINQAFDERYDTYEYAAQISKELVKRGVSKEVIGKEKILKDFGNMDEPYISYLNILLEE